MPEQQTERRNPIVVAPTERGHESGVTAGQIRAALAGVPDDVEVVLAADAEGNGFSPLAEVRAALYLPESTWGGDTYPRHEQIGRDGFTEDDRAPGDAYEVVVLWPTN